MQRLLLILSLLCTLAINGSAHGTGWVITQVAHQLGITKDWMELTPSDIDKLSNKQARGLAKIEREMWGCSKYGDGILCPITTKNSRDFLKQASVIYGRMDFEDEDPASFHSFRVFYLVRDKYGVHGPSKVNPSKPYGGTIEAPSENAARYLILRDEPNAVQFEINALED